MANEKNDISDIVKTCKILLLDIEGTTTSISFVKDRLFPYVDANVKEFLESNWEVEVVKEAVKALRDLASEDEEKKVDGVVTIPGEDASKEDQIEGLVKNVKWQMSLDRKIAPLKHLQGLVWRKGYDKGDIKGHIYEDVPPALELWRSVEGQKVYIFSSGSVHAQKLLFSMSSAGNIVHLIDGHFDTTLGPKQEAASYTAIAEKIGCKAEEILFLTDIDKEAEAARSAGVQVALMSREGNAPLAEAITTAFPVLYSFAELAATKKRKPDAQDEQQPAKVPKTDVEADVKTSTETQSKDSPQPITTPPKEKSEETENDKMEVEEEAPAKEETVNEQAKPEEIVEKSETIVKEITDLKEVADIPASDTKPIIVESPEKTDQKETEMMETEPADSISAPKQNGDNHAPGPEETPPVVITEIRDITNDKESLSEVTEIVEDLVPVVEEPPAQDMEDLQNVGEVLDKECDEILSKVQDVTNLDNMPLKPILNPIAEETMETENVDTNDIVEGILDSEQELEMKQCSDIDLNTVQEITEDKTVTGAEKCEKQDEVDKASEVVALEEKPSANVEAKVIEEEKLTEKKADDSCPKEEKVEESSVTTEVKVKESSSTAEDKVKENPTEEKTEESGVSQEKVEENGVTEETVKESIVEKKIEASSIPEEKAKESTVEQKMEESSITEEKIVESTVEQNIAESSLPEAKTEELKVAVDEVKSKIEEEKVETKMETDVCTAETQTAIRCTTETQTEEKTCLSTEDKSVTTENEVESKEVSVETTAEKPTDKPAEESSMDIDQTETSVETKGSEKIATPSAAEVVEPEKDSKKETQVNGKTTNGDADTINQNGDSSKEDELSARLSMENGKEVVNGANGANGANGDSAVAEAKSENKGDEVMDVADIKVKTVAMDEPRNDPIEQPTEA